MTGRKITWTAILLFSVLIALVALASLVSFSSTTPFELRFAKAASGQKEPPSEATITPVVAYQKNNIWFTGDVMLSRQVGQFAKVRGLDFPWRGLAGIFSTTTAYAVINFEGCSQEGVRFNQAESFRFAVDVPMLAALKTAGITHVSLANNHALDCGSGGHAASKALFEKNGITAIGHPSFVSTSSISYLRLASSTVGVVAIHTTFTEPSLSELTAVLTLLRDTSDIQVAFIHWGNEYEKYSSKDQQQLAQVLADLGIDIIIGHHPHVVQEVVRVGSALVFYSLGNVIFDQYFSEAVQEGLLLKFVEDGGPFPYIELYPISSQEERTQPHIMSGIARDVFLQELSARSESELTSEILAGKIEVGRYLATSSERVMIAP